MSAKPPGKDRGSNITRVPTTTVCPRITSVWVPAAAETVAVTVLPLMLCTGPLSTLPKAMALAEPVPVPLTPLTVTTIPSLRSFLPRDGLSSSSSSLIRAAESS